jgi:hypothetical protein
MPAQGGFKRGEGNPANVLTADNVREMRRNVTMASQRVSLRFAMASVLNRYGASAVVSNGAG